MEKQYAKLVMVTGTNNNKVNFYIFIGNNKL